MTILKVRVRRFAQRVHLDYLARCTDLEDSCIFDLEEALQVCYQ
jgi:hypothetical protein